MPRTKESTHLTSQGLGQEILVQVLEEVPLLSDEQLDQLDMDGFMEETWNYVNSCPLALAAIGVYLASPEISPEVSQVYYIDEVPVNSPPPSSTPIPGWDTSSLLEEDEDIIFVSYKPAPLVILVE